MNTELMTKREIRIRKRWDAIVDDFTRLRDENPEASGTRIINALAERYELSTTWVRRILTRHNVMS